MKTQTIKLLSAVIVAGKPAHPEDENKGIYTVTEAEARNLIARKRAIKFDGKIEESKGGKGNNNPSIDIDAVKKIAEELGVKFNNAIGAEKLEARVIEDLKAKAEEIGLTFAENLPLADAYEQYKAKVNEAKGDDDNKISVDELKEIAKAAEIEIKEDTADEDLQDFIELELEQYANELGLDVEENDDAKTLWAKIQEKLKESK